MCFLSLEVNRNQVDVLNHKEKAKKIDWNGFNYPVTRTEDTQNAQVVQNFANLAYCFIFLPLQERLGSPVR